MQIGSFSLIKELNTSVILNTIRDNKSISRAEIAKITGLTPATVTNITGELILKHLIVETTLGKSSGGRKPVMLELNTKGFNTVGVFIGSKYIDISISDLGANIIDTTFSEINDSMTSEEVIAKVIGGIKKVMKKANKKILGIGVGVHGLVRSKEGVSVLAPNLGWENVRINDLLESEFKLPVFVDNDVKTMTLGEKWFGAGRDADDFVMLYTGYGIGASLVTNGQIYRGALNYACEIGHTTIEAEGPLCSCGNRGCFQMLASEFALLQQIKENGYDKKYFDGEKIDVEEVIDKALAGNEDLMALLKKQAYYIGVGLANIINTFNPSMIILNGFIIKTGGILMPEILKQVQLRSLKYMQSEVNIIFSPLGRDAVFKGAVSLVLSGIFENPWHFFGE